VLHVEFESCASSKCDEIVKIFQQISKNLNFCVGYKSNAYLNPLSNISKSTHIVFQI